MDYSNFPEKLRALPQWICWKRVKEINNGVTRITKKPWKYDGSMMASSTDSSTWTTYENCIANVDHFDGIGFCFTVGTIGIDLDHCFEPDGTLMTWAREILQRFDTYTERSPSGDGLHIVMETDVILERGRRMPQIECYQSGRFFTVTGDVFEERSILRDCDILAWHKETFPVGTSVEEYPISIDLPSDDIILKALFNDSSTGSKHQRLYTTGDCTGFPSQSEAEFSLCSKLMFYCCNDIPTADRLFRASRLMREKWNRLGHGTLIKTRAASIKTWKRVKREVELILDRKGNPLTIAENIKRSMPNDAPFRYNEFSHLIECLHGSTWSNLEDVDILRYQSQIQEQNECFAKVQKNIVTDAIVLFAHANSVNPQREFFESLVWDEMPRLDFWLHMVYGTPNDNLHSVIGSNWLKGLVCRVLEPGYRFDEVLVLEGAQGLQKSESLRVLGSPWHTECTLGTDDKDFYMMLARNVIVEFSEGDIMTRTSAQKLKAVITKREDMYRPPYEHGMMTFKRSCVFAMTTNGWSISDDTGGRRWLPVVVRKMANIEWLADNREQLFAEAIYRSRVLHETSHEYPEEILEEQRDKREVDGYETEVQRWVEANNDFMVGNGVKTLDVWKNAVVGDTNTERVMTWHDEKRVNSILRRMGLDNPPRIYGSGRKERRWIAINGST